MRLCLVCSLIVACARGDASIVVTISPAMPTSSDSLVATVTGRVRPEDTLRWSKNGAVQAITGTTVGASMIARGDVWKVEVVATGQAVADAEVTIGASPPSAPLIALPTSAAPATALACVITSPSIDIDGEPITYSAAWTRNGAAFVASTTTSFAGDTVPNGSVADGDDFTCVVTATAAGLSTPSAPAETRSTCVGNTPPATTFSFTGASQRYTVPSCTTKLVIEAWGAQGGGPQGGGGGYVRGELDGVTAGAVLVVEVGGQQRYNGGGLGIAAANAAHGGGASDVRSVGGALSDRILVAGGGGGGITGDTGAHPGGTGGGGGCSANYCGGGGGAGYGGAGGVGAAAGGTGITNAHAGGAGGGGMTSGGGGSCETYDAPSTCGGVGALGTGGDGGPAMAHAVCYSTYGGTAGGGGGYYGGGGTAIGFCGGGGGGGGTSWSGTLAAPAFQPGARTGDGKVVITPM